MAAVKIIADTGPLVGYLDADDQWHEWSVASFKQLTGPLITCEAVISEASYLLGKDGDGKLLEMIEAGALEIHPLLPRESPRLRQLIARYPERMQFADACIVRLSELHSTARIFTTDKRDFQIYRRNRNERLQLISP